MEALRRGAAAPPASTGVDADADGAKRARVEEASPEDDEILALLGEIDATGSVAVSAPPAMQSIPMPSISLSSTNDFFDEARPASRSPSRPTASAGLVNLLPHPFLPESFAISDFSTNVDALTRAFPASWDARLTIKQALRLDPAQKVPLMLLMVKECPINALDAGVVFADESGEIGGTIHQQLLSRNKVRVHFGLSVLVQDCTVFSPSLALPTAPPTARHLLLTPRNLIAIFCNVHNV